MAWKKLDDSLAVSDASLTALIARRISDNASTYPVALSRGIATAWDALGGVPEWSSYDIATGCYVTVDTGTDLVAGSTLSIRVSYATASASLGGTLSAVIIYGGTGAASVAAPATASPTTTSAVTLNIGVEAEIPRGPITLWIGWRSDVAAEPYDTLDVYSGVGNQVTYSGGTGTYSGKVHAVIQLPALLTPSVGTTPKLRYQVCGGELSGSADFDGWLYVWPDIQTTPPVIPAVFDVAKVGNGDVYELGAIRLYGVGVSIGGVEAPVADYGFAHDVATSPNAIYTPALDAAAQYTHQVMASAGGQFPDWVAMPLDTSGTFSTTLRAYFATKGRADQNLDLALWWMPLRDTTETVTFTFTLRDAITSTTVYTVSGPYIATPVTPKQTLEGGAWQAVCLGGARGNPAAWGMADAAEVDDIGAAGLLGFTLPGGLLSPLTGYEVLIETDAPVLILNIYIGNLTAVVQ